MARKTSVRRTTKGRPTSSRAGARRGRSAAVVSGRGPLAGFHDRLESVIGGETIEAVADRTGVNRESVRRYRNGAKPSAEFVVEVCRAYGLSSDWLLGLKKTRR